MPRVSVEVVELEKMIDGAPDPRPLNSLSFMRLSYGTFGVVLATLCLVDLFQPDNPSQSSVETPGQYVPEPPRDPNVVEFNGNQVYVGN